MLKRGLFGAVIGLAVASASPAFAQNQPGGPGGAPLDAAAIRSMMNDRIKTQLNASDEQWKTIEPRLEKLQTAQREAQSGGRGGFGGGRGGAGGGGRGGPGGAGGFGGGGGFGGAGGAAGDPNAQGGGRRNRGGGGFGGFTQEPTEVQTKLQALQEAIQDPNASPDDIASKARGLRDAKTKAKAALLAAQEDLSSVLTARQQYVLLSMGYLE